MSDIMDNAAGKGLRMSGRDYARLKEMQMQRMKEMEDQKKEIEHFKSAEYMEKCKNEAEELFKPIADYIEYLERELEEERQENASLRSGDDYERGAE